jgi:hypothetical protein
MKIVCDFLFEEMKNQYKNMSYLKISVLVPSRTYLYNLDVVGFIIGIDGKNINRIRDMSGSRIEVFQHDINNKYRQIELAGNPVDISRAAEKIYRIVNKYYFTSPANARRPNPSDERDKKRRSAEPRSRIRLMKKQHHGKVTFI